jgi:hypothetical protein
LRLGTLKRAVPLSLLIAVEAALQRLGHWALVTPSIFVRSRAVGGESPDRGRLWRCPACGSLEVAEAEAGVDCRGCGRHWPRRDGIYEFRLPPATSPDPTPKL